MRDITLGITFRHPFTTRAFATGIPTVLAGSPVLSVLEENNATPITAGVSVSVDRASVVGLNEATIVATSGNGYENGKSYGIYISTGTVDGVSVIGEVVGEFTIGQSAAAVDLANVTDGLSALKALLDIIDTNVDDIETDTGTTIPGLIAALNDLSAAEVNTQVDLAWTTQMADSMVAKGTIPTREQALLFINRFLQEFAILSTTLTVNKEDAATPIATFTLDDASNPTSLTRAT